MRYTLLLEHRVRDEIVSQSCVVRTYTHTIHVKQNVTRYLINLWNTSKFYNNCLRPNQTTYGQTEISTAR